VKECIGIPFPDTDAKLVDPEDASREVARGESGELAVRGPQVMKGYWNHPEETAAVLRNGWLLTGDIAKMDEDGYFYIVDRKKDLILCSGYNVYPREVEEVLFTHPAVAEAAAIGVPDAYRGESVKAFVVLKGGMNATEAEIIAFSKERLAAYKVPKAVEFTKDLPKSLVGKVLRRELRERELAKSGPAA
jgi:long-chain acyl-CoA synthetase